MSLAGSDYLHGIHPNFFDTTVPPNGTPQDLVHGVLSRVVTSYFDLSISMENPVVVANDHSQATIFVPAVEFSVAKRPQNRPSIPVGTLGLYRVLQKDTPEDDARMGAAMVLKAPGSKNGYHLTSLDGPFGGNLTSSDGIIYGRSNTTSGLIRPHSPHSKYVSREQIHLTNPVVDHDISRQGHVIVGVLDVSSNGTVFQVNPMCAWKYSLL